MKEFNNTDGWREGREDQINGFLAHLTQRVR
jgi:hypothetical protein